MSEHMTPSAIEMRDFFKAVDAENAAAVKRNLPETDWYDTDAGKGKPEEGSLVSIDGHVYHVSDVTDTEDGFTASFSLVVAVG